MQRTDFSLMACPIARSLDRVGEWWSILILRDAFHGLTRFDQFQKSLGIARNVLSDRLKKLVGEGVLDKTDGPGHPEYRLTEKGLALQPVMIAMTHWGDTYMPHPDGPRLTFVDRKDGLPIKPVGIYADDGRRLKPKELRAKAGPGLQDAHLFARSTPVENVDKADEGVSRTT